MQRDHNQFEACYASACLLTIYIHLHKHCCSPDSYQQHCLPAQSIALVHAAVTSPQGTPIYPSLSFSLFNAKRRCLFRPYCNKQCVHRYQHRLHLLHDMQVSLAIQSFVAQHLGSSFTEPPPFNLAGAFLDSSNTTPLIFVLSPGADPMADLLKLADELRFAKKFEKVSLGQGQGPKVCSHSTWFLTQGCLVLWSRQHDIQNLLCRTGHTVSP